MKFYFKSNLIIIHQPQSPFISPLFFKSTVAPSITANHTNKVNKKKKNPSSSSLLLQET